MKHKLIYPILVLIFFLTQVNGLSLTETGDNSALRPGVVIENLRILIGESREVPSEAREVEGEGCRGDKAIYSLRPQAAGERNNPMLMRKPSAPKKEQGTERIIPPLIAKEISSDEVFLGRFDPKRGALTIVTRERVPGSSKVRIMRRTFFRRVDIPGNLWRSIVGRLKEIRDKRKDLENQFLAARRALWIMFNRDLEIFCIEKNVLIIKGREYSDLDTLQKSQVIFTKAFLLNYLHTCRRRTLNDQERELVESARQLVIGMNEGTTQKVAEPKHAQQELENCV